MDPQGSTDYRLRTAASDECATGSPRSWQNSWSTQCRPNHIPGMQLESSPKLSFTSQWEMRIFLREGPQTWWCAWRATDNMVEGHAYKGKGSDLVHQCGKNRVFVGRVVVVEELESTQRLVYVCGFMVDFAAQRESLLEFFRATFRQNSYSNQQIQ